MLEKHAESDTRCYVEVRPANRAGLTRRELTPRIIARFQAKFQPIASDQCWLWTASCFKGGYGMFAVGRNLDGRQHTEYAHRIAFVVHNRVDIPAGAVVMHSCDVPKCVNPHHLSLGTQGDNVRDAATKGHYNVSKPGIQKLTDAHVRFIRESAEKSVVLAKLFGVSKSCISQIRNGHSRKAA